MPSSLFGTNTTTQTSNVQTNNQFNQFKTYLNLLRSGGNPNAIMSTLMQSNPQMASVMNLVNQHGGDARTAFFEEAKRRGVDPDQIINMLK